LRGECERADSLRRRHVLVCGRVVPRLLELRGRLLHGARQHDGDVKPVQRGEDVPSECRFAGWRGKLRAEQVLPAGLRDRN